MKPIVTVEQLREWRRTLEGAFYVGIDEQGVMRNGIDHGRVEGVLRAIECAEEEAYREEARALCRTIVAVPVEPVPVEPELGWVGTR